MEDVRPFLQFQRRLDELERGPTRERVLLGRLRTFVRCPHLEERGFVGVAKWAEREIQGFPAMTANTREILASSSSSSSSLSCNKNPKWIESSKSSLEKKDEQQLTKEERASLGFALNELATQLKEYLWPSTGSRGLEEKSTLRGVFPFSWSQLIACFPVTDLQDEVSWAPHVVVHSRGRQYHAGVLDRPLKFLMEPLVLRPILTRDHSPSDNVHPEEKICLEYWQRVEGTIPTSPADREEVYRVESEMLLGRECSPDVPCLLSVISSEWGYSAHALRAQNLFMLRHQLPVELSMIPVFRSPLQVGLLFLRCCQQHNSPNSSSPFHWMAIKATTALPLFSSQDELDTLLGSMINQEKIPYLWTIAYRLELIDNPYATVETTPMLQQMPGWLLPSFRNCFNSFFPESDIWIHDQRPAPSSEIQEILKNQVIRSLERMLRQGRCLGFLTCHSYDSETLQSKQFRGKDLRLWNLLNSLGEELQAIPVLRRQLFHTDHHVRRLEDDQILQFSDPSSTLHHQHYEFLSLGGQVRLSTNLTSPYEEENITINLFYACAFLLAPRDR